MSVIMILSTKPYDGTDKTWNALRLANNLLEKKVELKIFLINDAIDLAKDACRKGENDEHDLVIEMKKVINHGAQVKACANSQNKCGQYKNEFYYDSSLKGTIYDLSDWIIISNKVISF